MDPILEGMQAGKTRGDSSQQEKVRQGLTHASDGGPAQSFSKVFQETAQSQQGRPPSEFALVVQRMTEEDLRRLRKQKVEEIRLGMTGGDPEAVRKAQDEYDSCTAELRKRQVAYLSLNATPAVACQPAPIISAAPQVKAVEAQVPKVAEVQVAAASFPVVDAGAASAALARPVESKGPIQETLQPVQVKAAAPVAEKAPAQVEQKVALAPQPTPASDNIFGIGEDAWKKLGEDISFKATILSMPEDVVSLYKLMPLDDKKEMNKELHGKTTVLFWTVDHKEAFIKGTAMGRNTFDEMANSIDEDVRKKKLTKEEADVRKGAIGLFRTLTPDQRRAFVRLLEEDLGSTGASKAPS